MVRHTHSAQYWERRCIVDTPSDDENVSPNVCRTPRVTMPSEAPTYCKESDTEDELPGSTGTLTPPWDHHRSPVRSRRAVAIEAQSPSEHGSLTTSISRSSFIASPTTSSTVLLETPSPSSRPPPRLRPSARSPLSSPPTFRSDRPTNEAEHRTSRGRASREDRRARTALYARPREALARAHNHPVVNPRGLMRTSPTRATPSHDRVPRQRRTFVPADWPCRVARLREQYNPSGIVFPRVQHFGLCGCLSPCRMNTCTNSLMHVFCNVNCCEYSGQCGNGLVESTKVYLARDVQARALAVVATERIDAGVVLGEYLGELKHVSLNRAKRPRNTGYRLLMTQRPERPAHPICVAINAERLGSLMRFVNHSCQPCARFVEVSNGRRTTVVVVTTEVIHAGEEIVADYGRDLWFVCRCRMTNCCHRQIQDQQDP